MTRFLSEALEAQEPYFRHGLRRLEAANGNPSTDIRFSSEISVALQAKLHELGLDPKDTSAPELYEALKERVRADDQLLLKKLRTLAATYVSAEADLVAGMVEALKRLPDSRRCFALKPSRLKSLLKANPPKKAMKSLGYRSLDSMLKHEALALILAAAWLSESPAWRKRLLEQYKRLSPSDFEERSMTVLHPTSKRWRTLAEKTVNSSLHNILCFKELGSIVLLPLPGDVPAGVTTVSLSLALHELNEIRACSSYLKLHQVQANFGELVARSALNEPELNSHLLDRPVAWNLIQRYYSRLNKRFKEEVFEPYVRLEDMVWQPIEKALSAIEPSLAFWQDTAHLALLHERKPVSLNIIDNALNLCNDLAFEKRASHYAKRSLWHELLLRYLKHEPIEQTVLSELTPQLVEERVLA